MFTLQWTEELDTGIDEVDREHRELFDRVNTLFSNLMTRRGSCLSVGKQKEAIDFFEHFVREHFCEEERLMRKVNYEQIRAHKEDHSKIRRMVAQLKPRLLEGPSDPESLAVINQLLGNFLIQHTCTHDHAFAKACPGSPTLGETVRAKTMLRAGRRRSVRRHFNT